MSSALEPVLIIFRQKWKKGCRLLTGPGVGHVTVNIFAHNCDIDRCRPTWRN